MNRNLLSGLTIKTEPKYFAELLLKNSIEDKDSNKVWVWSHIILRKDFSDFVSALFTVSIKKDIKLEEVLEKIKGYQEKYSDTSFYKKLSVLDKDLFDDIFSAILYGHANVWRGSGKLCLVPISYSEGITMEYDDEKKEKILKIKNFVTPTDLRDYISKDWDGALGNAMGGINIKRTKKRNKVGKNQLRDIKIYKVYKNKLKEGLSATRAESETATWIEKNYNKEDFKLDSVRHIAKEVRKRERAIN